MQKKSVFWNQNWKFILTGKRRNGGFFTPLPRLSSWNWMSWETSWAMDLAVGGSLCTYWNVKKFNLEFEVSSFKYPYFSEPTFLACLQSQPLTCSRAEMVSGASQNLVAGPPEFLGCRDAIFVCRLSAQLCSLLCCCWLNHSRLEKPTSSKILTPLQNIRSSVSLHFQFKNWRDM